ncbi:hypothetical protein CF319_g3068 [Tilletia indica]|nr:hypothetical protein CF319_g3068 [Tilletia indica]
MAPKKQQKMSIHDFLADTTTGGGSWADDIDDLPSAPTSRDDRGGYTRPSGLAGAPDRGASSYGGMGGGGGGDRGYPSREELPLPTRAPFTAFVGNLAFEISDGDIAEFFAPHVAVSIRLVMGPDGKPKGFGYVEFETLDGLKEALNRSGSQMNGRNVRVSVAEPPKEGGFGARRTGGPRRGEDEFGNPSAAEEASQWRRTGPLPAAEPAPGGLTRRGSNDPRAGGGRAGPGERMPMGMGPGAGAGAGPGGPMEPGAGDVANEWRTGKAVGGPPPGQSSGSAPFSSPRRGSQDRAAGPGVDGGARTPQLRRRESNNVAAGTELDAKYAGAGERMGFGSKFSAGGPAGGAGGPLSPAIGGGGPLSPSSETPGGPVRRTSKFGAGGAGQQGSEGGAVVPEASNWRTAPRRQPTGSLAPEGGAAGGSSSGGATPPTGGAATTPSAAAVPAERKRLELKPRSSAAVLDAAAMAKSSNETTDASPSKPSPFGAARPVNAAEREREIEERLVAKREDERKERETKRAEEKERKATAAASSGANKAGAWQQKEDSSSSAEKTAAGAVPAASAAVDPVAASDLTNGSATGAGAAEGTTTSDATSSTPATATDAPEPPPSTPRAPPPTGAWGKGRKASGALAAAAAAEAAEKESAKAEGKEEK